MIEACTQLQPTEWTYQNSRGFSCCIACVSVLSIIMMIFDFLKRLFGWADEGSRKRRASDTLNLEAEFINVKRHRCNHDMGHHQKSVDESKSDIENDDIEVLTEYKYSPSVSIKLSNGVRGDRRKSFSFSKSTFSNLVGKCSLSHHANHDESNVGCSIDKSNTNSCLVTDHKYSTLAKTYKLREKKQYGEMLQNFIPHRVHTLNSKPNQQRAVQRTTEVIDLEKNEQSPVARNVQSTRRTSLPSQSEWHVQSNRRKHTVLSNKVNNDDSIERMLAQSFRKTKTERDEAGASKLIRNIPVEVVATNSLRDKLAARAVMKEDFIPQVSKKYNARMEQRYKEAEELKKMTGLLSKHNRLAREVALEEQLARSMRLCEAVLDETEEPEELALPVLTPEILQEIKNALVPRPPSEVLIESFGLRITRKDIYTLSGLNWLNDEVINFYMNLLIVRGTGDKFPKVHAMNTFFYPKLLSGGHASLKRWTRKVDIFAQDLLIVPVHLGIHWCMSIIDFRDKSICYYDSMGGSNSKCLSALQQYLEEESLDKHKKPFNTDDWKLECAKNIPQQMNGSDCGVFSCMFAEYVCANKKITFTQQDMPYFRNKMVYEILKCKLL